MDELLVKMRVETSGADLEDPFCYSQSAPAFQAPWRNEESMNAPALHYARVGEWEDEEWTALS